jgi:NADH-quinone oxidoreductase subunit L
MLDIKTLLLLIPAFPLAAVLITAVGGRRVLRRWCWLPTVAAITLSFLASVFLLFQVQGQIDQAAANGQHRWEQVVTLYHWCDVSTDADQTPFVAGTQARSNPQSLIPNSSFRVDVVLRADSLTAAMLAIVTCVSLLVAIYSIGYMRGDPGVRRFFAYVGLFVFAMTMLVSASNFALLYVFWELVGLCSYLLIGFWYERPATAAAGMKAFLVNRIGDVGFTLGIFLIWTVYGSLNFHDTNVHGVLGQWRLDTGDFFTDWRATAICLLLLLGACGKSAQFPLHVWLPDAMEGPTPVSALIHAATMVTAGVYMVARCMPLFAASVDAQHTVAIIGGITALLGAVIALTQTDLKRILAYSTISHLGYMFVALGVGTLAGVTAAMFHLLTHAFFKALLFLGAGSVMHAAGGVIDIRRLGGLRRRLPTTYWTFLIGCLAIAGVAPLSGFWSKDAILAAVQSRTGELDGSGIYEFLLLSMLLGVFLGGFYVFRPFFLVFHGPERIPDEAGQHMHESPGTMTAPLLILAFGAAVVGAYFEWKHGFANFLAATPSLDYLSTHVHAKAVSPVATESFFGLSAVGLTLTVLSIAAAAFVYLGRREKAAKLARAMNIFGLYSLSLAKFFFDPLYAALVVRPMLLLARAAAWFDRMIDFSVDFVGRVPSLLGGMLRPAQNGLIPFYALVMALGVLAMLGALLM